MQTSIIQHLQFKTVSDSIPLVFKSILELDTTITGSECGYFIQAVKNKKRPLPLACPRPILYLHAC